MFQYERSMSQSLNQRTNFHISFLGISTDSPDFLFTKCIASSNFRPTCITQFILYFPNNSVDLIIGKFVYHLVIIFRTIQMMLRIPMNSPIGYSWIIFDRHTRNHLVKITAIFQQLFQCLTTIKQTFLMTGLNLCTFLIDNQNISFFRLWNIFISQYQFQIFAFLFIL